MPPSVVDRFEAVEIDKQHRNHLVGYYLERSQIVPALLERPTIGETCERVFVCDTSESSLRCLAICDVFLDSDANADAMQNDGTMMNGFDRTIVAPHLYLERRDFRNANICVWPDILPPPSCIVAILLTRIGTVDPCIDSWKIVCMITERRREGSVHELEATVRE